MSPDRPAADPNRGGAWDEAPEPSWAHGGGPGWRTALAVLVALGGGLGVVLLVIALLTAPSPPPQPAPAQAPPAAATRTAPTAPAATGTPSPAGAAAPLPASVPVRIDVADARVHAPVMALDVDRHREVEVPPIDRPYLAGWYDRSVTPGQTGAAVLLGHVDSHRTGPAVFYYLGALRAGARIEVTRADHRVAVFRVDGVAGYPKDRFPAEAVYGPADTPTLRLVTCGGTFDERTDSYRQNVVVYASLVSAHRQTPRESARPLVTRPPD